MQSHVLANNNNTDDNNQNIIIHIIYHNKIIIIINIKNADILLAVPHNGNTEMVIKISFRSKSNM
jgi:hypothetical protein